MMTPAFVITSGLVRDWTLLWVFHSFPIARLRERSYCSLEVKGYGIDLTLNIAAFLSCFSLRITCFSFLSCVCASCRLTNIHQHVRTIARKHTQDLRAYVLHSPLHITYCPYLALVRLGFFPLRWRWSFRLALGHCAEAGPWTPPERVGETTGQSRNIGVYSWNTANDLYTNIDITCLGNDDTRARTCTRTCTRTHRFGWCRYTCNTHTYFNI